MEFIDSPFDEEEVSDLVIADIPIQGVYEVRETGSGFTEEYRAERERESGGQDDVDEPPAANLHIQAFVEEETWESFNELREREDPFPVAVGPFVFEMMGITNLERRVEAEYPEAIHMTLELQEYRELIVQRRSLEEVFGGGGGAGMGMAGEAVEIPEGWVDDGTGRDVRTGQPIPETRTETVPNGARPVHTVGGGQSFGRIMFDAAGSGASPVISTSGTGWAVQDVGINGPSHNRQDAFMGLTTNGGGGRVDHIYIGDGSPHPRGTGMWYDVNSTGNIHFSLINGQLWRDNMIYASAPGGSAQTLIENSFAYNNEVASYRLAQGEIRNTVGHHDASHSGRGNRVIWAWSPGGISVVNSHILNANGWAIQGDAAGSNAPVSVSGGGVSGNVRGPVSGAGGTPNIRAFHSQIPGSAIDAARGYAPGV